MYRRLKNLLGVSLIILAIVLSQLPMGAVQAVTTPEQGAEQETNGETSGEDVDANGADTNNSDVTDGTSTDGEDVNESGSNSDSNNETSDDTDSLENQPAVVDDGESETSGTGTTKAEYTVEFDYGFEGLNGITQKLVQEGTPINKVVADDEWKISVDGGSEVIDKSKTYTIKGHE